MDFHDICEKVYSGQYLNYDEAKFAFDTILTGEINDIVISSFLTALRVRGHQLDEIYGAASALLDAARPFPTPYYDFCDIVGTGGDGFKTINISTISAFVAAALGLIAVLLLAGCSGSAANGSFDAYSWSELSDIAKALALGADAVAVATGALMAAGCQQYRICGSGNCPVGIATQDPELRKRLDMDAAAQRVGNYLNVLTEELKTFARITGNESVHDLSLKELMTTSRDIADFTEIPYVGKA